MRAFCADPSPKVLQGTPELRELMRNAAHLCGVGNRSPWRWMRLEGAVRPCDGARLKGADWWVACGVGE